MALNTKDLAMGPNFYQTISLSGREAAYTIHGYELKIHASEASSGVGHASSGSSKVKISTITNQNWDIPKHHGNIVASNNHYLVYVLKIQSGYVLRLIHKESKNRVLLKGFIGAILDVSFAHAGSNLLACVDEGGNLQIWDLDRAKEVSEIPNVALKVAISRNKENMFTPDGLDHRLVWSPFVPQEDEEEQETCNIVVTHGNDVEVFDVHVLFKELPSGIKYPKTALKKGILTIKDAHEKVIHDVSLSPDGAVLATASEDGHLKFWQVDWSLADDSSDEKPKCLHDFQPHRGSPVSRLIFCDDHLSQDPAAQFWRFLLTAANGNTEVKLWCTVSWKCLQTFTFYPSLGASEQEPTPHILLNLDLSASYLLAADSKRMALYILQLFHDGSLGDASVTSITEYLLTQPIYSFVVSGHTPLSSREGSVSGDEGDGEDEKTSAVGEFDSRRNIVLITLHCIQPRSMQELLVKFEPPDLMGVPPPPTTSSLSNDLLSSNLVPKSSSPQSVPAVPRPLPPIQVPIIPTAGSQPLSPLHTLTVSTPPHHTSSLTDSHDSPTSTLFHSLTNLASGSPKLLTPSEFTSPAKPEPSPLQSSSLPLLTPPPVAATTIPSTTTQEQPDESDSPQPTTVPTTSQADLTSDVITSSSPLPRPAAVSTSTTPPPPTHEASGGTQTSATLTSVTEFNLTDESDHETDIGETTARLSELSSKTKIEPTAVEEQPLQSESHDQSHDQSRDLTTTEMGEEEKRGKVESTNIDDGQGSLRSAGADKKKAEVNDSEGQEEDGELSTEVVQQSMDNIFKLLKIENPHSSTDNSQSVGFEEFTKMLNDPTLVQQSGPLTSTEKSVILGGGGEGATSDEFVPLAPRSSRGDTKGSSSVGVEDESSEIVNATGAPTPAEHLQLLKDHIPPAESDQVPLLSDLGVTDESIAESLAEQKKGEGEEVEEAPWPDIGQPEPGMEMKVVHDDEIESKLESTSSPALQTNDSGGGGDGSTVATTTTMTTIGAGIVPSVAMGDGGGGEPLVVRKELPSVVSGELPPVVIKGLPPVVSGLVMPSADVAIDIAAVENGERSHDISAEQSRDHGQQLQAEEQSERDGTPGIPEQEGEGLGQEVGGGMLPTELVSKSKKKTRRGSRAKAKKANAGSANLGTAGLVEVIGYSDSEQESDVMAAIGQLSQRLAKQREEIDQLRMDQHIQFQALTEKLDGLAQALIGAQRSALAEHAKEQQQKLDKVLRDKQQSDKKSGDRLAQSVSQSVTSAVNSKMEKLVKNEMKNAVVPSVNRAMGTLTEQLTVHLQRWLSSADANIKETLTRALQTRGLPEQIGGAVAASIANTYQESFRSTVLPGFERSCTEMMKQVDENFRRGTQDYLSQVQLQHQHYHNPPLQHLHASVQSLHSSLQSWLAPPTGAAAGGGGAHSSPLYSNIQACLHQEMATLTQQIKQIVSEVVSAAVQKEVGAAMQEQVMRMSPEVRQEEERRKKQEDIQRYIRSQEYNSAFEVALSTSDLQLVVSLCQQLSPDDVIDSPLSQPVLLSLIQQLSVNLQEHLELKLKYLEQCTLSLDVDNEVTRSHMSTVILQLSQQLALVEKSFEVNPSAAKPALKKNVKRLKMISERLCQPQ